MASPAVRTVAPPTTEIGRPDYWWGTWGQGLVTEWWETAADLVWPQSVITYGRMRHDPQLKAVLSAFILPMLRATWAVDGTGCRDQVTRHVADDFGLPVLGRDEHPGPARRRGLVWTRHLRQACAKLVFGHMPFERRYQLDETSGLYHLVNLGPRMPWTVAEINLTADGSIAQVVQSTQQEPIDARRLVWYGHEVEGSAWAGTSVLRPAFGAWLLKHETWRVHATSIRRFGMGVPTVEAPPGATAGQVAEAQALASGMRAGDQTGAGLPPGYRFALAGLTGSVPDALGFVRYLDQQMSKMALAGLVDLGQTETGSRALGETFLDLFLLALQGLADEVATETTSGYPGMPGAVTDLVDVNYGEDEPAPRIVCTDIGEQHEVTAEAIRSLLQYGGLTADPELEAYLRQTWRLPQRKTPAPPPVPGGAPPGQPAPGGRPDGGAGPEPAPPVSAAGPGGLRRALTPAEIRAGFDPVLVQAQWRSELDWLLSRWTPVFAAQRDSLAEQVAAAVDAGQLGRLANLAADSKAGARLLRDAMLSLAGKAAEEMIREAASQNVTVSPDRVKIPKAGLGKVAAARAALAAGYVAGQAGQRALQVVQASAGTDAADYVTAHLNGLSQVSLRDQLGAALSAAQNAGRAAVLEAAPASAGEALYVATEVLDENTCGPCEYEDGTEYASLEEAQAAYANGGYIECEGGLRCRGTIMAVWGGGEVL